MAKSSFWIQFLQKGSYSQRIVVFVNVYGNYHLFIYFYL